ncbi:FAD-binding oxidoreductase [Phaeobacter inhibens]|uniref:FAD-binding oxidoreductase n=1 Tax=Phaeobacter inhibens TaxID=221822 RepID=UPI0018F4A8D5|nr:FAD-binding oxidoreductase [Phaeobacter inhibens]UWR54817.1 hypothetical protein K4F84_09810 [Phaeobacter inhibens]UWR58747.1 hypothetical protein K4F89_13260 [Phaeobacter inhibens]UWR70410.1 hypothetical protein K4K95_09650 [Phaeobacter inhibens]
MDISQISALLAPVIGTQNVITGERLALRNTGYCAASYDGGVLLTPGSAQDVSKICWLAAEHGLAIVPQGGLTGLVQGTATAPGQPPVLGANCADRLRRNRRSVPSAGQCPQSLWRQPLVI